MLETSFLGDTKEKKVQFLSLASLFELTIATRINEISPIVKISWELNVVLLSSYCTAIRWRALP
jgi:PIN domain nuclease of toxin-antitoxin system